MERRRPASAWFRGLYDDAERARRIMGDDFWSYGLERNTEVLATFLRYAHEQGLAGRLLEPAELFAPETLESFVQIG